MNELNERPGRRPRAQREPRAPWWDRDGAMRWTKRQGVRVPSYECVPNTRERMPLAEWVALMERMLRTPGAAAHVDAGQE
jgi:hypothetical protein